MDEKRYKAIRIEDYTDEPVQYAAVYVTRWDNKTMGEPSVLFVEIDDDEKDEVES